jgi:purine-binding chemotaxis protein CheW
MSAHFAPETSSQPSADQVELISFQIRDQYFCADLMAIREIRSWTQASPLPQAPDFIRGVVNLRGTVLPIVDLAARLGLGATEPSARHAILVAEIADQLVGLLVDGVSEILSLPKDSLQATPHVGCQVTREFVRGLIPLDGRMLALLSLDRIVPAIEMIEAQAA